MQVNAYVSVGNGDDQMRMALYCIDRRFGHGRKLPTPRTLARCHHATIE
jgi:hypothetical protein